jgi:hypothetical protein
MHPINNMPDDYKHNQDPMQVPEGYFDQFNNRLAERLPLTKRNNWYWVASAAAAAALAIPALYWMNTAPQPLQSTATVLPDTAPLTAGLRLDDETLATYLQQEANPAVQTETYTIRQPAVPVTNTSLLSEEDLLRAGLLRAEEFETFDPML